MAPKKESPIVSSKGMAETIPLSSYLMTKGQLPAYVFEKMLLHKNNDRLP